MTVALGVSADASRLPELSALTQGLCRALAVTGTGTTCEIIDRQPMDYVSTFPSEVLTCVIDGRKVRVFSKYGGVVADHVDHGSRGCVPYEAKVYQHLLPRLGVSAPRYLGVYEENPRGRVWLFLEYLEDSRRVHRVAQEREGLCAAAAWVGRLHANASRLEPLPAWIIRYDGVYFEGWVERTLAFAGRRGEDLSWLEPLCRQGKEALRELLDEPTIIHGEFFPMNILLHRSEIYPVDWESTALGAGEIDLVALTDGWPDEVAWACRDAYCRARWPEGTPEAFGRRLSAARLYNQFRWLGSRPGWTTSPHAQALFTALRVAGRQAGLVA